MKVPEAWIWTNKNHTVVDCDITEGQILKLLAEEPGGILNPMTLRRHNINANFAQNLNHNSPILGVLNPQGSCPLEGYVVCVSNVRNNKCFWMFFCISLFPPSSVLGCRFHRRAAVGRCEG